MSRPQSGLDPRSTARVSVCRERRIRVARFRLLPYASYMHGYMWPMHGHSVSVFVTRP